MHSDVHFEWHSTIGRHNEEKRCNAAVLFYDISLHILPHFSCILLLGVSACQCPHANNRAMVQAWNASQHCSSVQLFSNSNINALPSRYLSIGLSSAISSTNVSIVNVETANRFAAASTFWYAFVCVRISFSDKIWQYAAATARAPKRVNWSGDDEVDSTDGDIFDSDGHHLSVDNAHDSSNQLHGLDIGQDERRHELEFQEFEHHNRQPSPPRPSASSSMPRIITDSQPLSSASSSSARKYPELKLGDRIHVYTSRSAHTVSHPSENIYECNCIGWRLAKVEQQFRTVTPSHRLA